MSRMCAVYTLRTKYTWTNGTSVPRDAVSLWIIYRTPFILIPLQNPVSRTTRILLQYIPSFSNTTHLVSSRFQSLLFDHSTLELISSPAGSPQLPLPVLVLLQVLVQVRVPPLPWRQPVGCGWRHKLLTDQWKNNGMVSLYTVMSNGGGVELPLHANSHMQHLTQLPDDPIPLCKWILILVGCQLAVKYQRSSQVAMLKLITQYTSQYPLYSNIQSTNHSKFDPLSCLHWCSFQLLRSHPIRRRGAICSFFQLKILSLPRLKWGWFGKRVLI